MENVELSAARDSLEAGTKRAIAELQRLYPKGSRIAFTIKHGQVNHSTGTVGSHEVHLSPWGPVGFAVYVSHDQAKSGSRYRHRSVPLANIRGTL